MGLTYEHDWWDFKDSVEAKRNAWGVPPYPVDRVARRIGVVLGLTPGDTVLDLGCGPARTALAVAARFKVFVEGVDPSPAMLELARKAKPNHANVSLVQNDGSTIPGNALFEAAYSVTVFEHIPHPITRLYLHQVHQRLVKGGRFVFSHTPGSDPQAPHHHQCVVADVYRWCEEAGFRKFLDIPEDTVLDREVWRWFAMEK